MDQEKIWSHFQNNPDANQIAFGSDARYYFLAKQISPKMKVLNIGVGRGGLEELLLSKEIDIYCLDPSEESINSIKSKFGIDSKAKVGYSQSIPFDDNYFDIVIMTEVLEHLSDEILNMSIKECHRVLRVGGVFLGTVPADEKLIDNQVVCPDCAKIFHRWGHVQSFSSDGLKMILSVMYSGVIIKRKYFGNWKTLNWKGRVSWILKQTALNLGIKGSGENFFFSGIKQQ